MVFSHSRKLAIVVLLVGVVSVVMGGVFIFESIDKSNLITEAMCLENVEYGGADGTIQGIIDTPAEAQVMAGILKEHRFENYGHYTELERDDPNRQKILNAMTMENSLNLAQMGYGLAEVVRYTGIFMVVIGLTLGVSTVSVIRSSK